MPDGAKPYCSHCLEDFDALNRRARDVSSAATAPQASHDRQPASASASLWHCSLPVVAAVACLPWPRPPAVACDSHRRVGFGLGLGAQLAPPDVGGMAPHVVERRGAQTVAGGLSGGVSQRQIALQATRSFGQPWPSSRLGRAGTQAAPALCFRAGATTAAAVAASSAVPAAPILRHCPASASRRRRACASAASPSIPTR